MSDSGDTGTIMVRAVYDNETVEDGVRLIDAETLDPAARIARVGVKLGESREVFSAGRWLRVDVSVELPAYVEEIDDAVKHAEDIARRHYKRIVDGVKSQVKQRLHEDRPPTIEELT